LGRGSITMLSLSASQMRRLHAGHRSCPLNGNVAEQELNLLQFPLPLVAISR
jgi:hypothetical protein